MAADKAYDASALRQQLEDEALRIYTPRKYARSTLPPGFRYQAKADRVICPAGVMRRPTPHPQGLRLRLLPADLPALQPESYLFERRSSAPARLPPPGQGSEPRGDSLAMWAHKVIERVFADAKKRRRLGRARYRGRLGVAFQAVMTFFVLNTKKLSCWQ